jgi:hypothetical protein
MARGSSPANTTKPSFESVEMVQSGGQIDNSGKYTVSKKYYVTNEADLITTPASISVGGKIMIPAGLSYQKIAGGIWEKNIEYTAPVRSTETGVVAKLSGTNQPESEGRLQLEVSAELAPIEQHPEIDDLLKKYNGTVEKGKAVFPRTYTPTGAGTSGGNPQTNPFFGVRYYYQPSATLRVSYTVDRMPGNLWAGVFCIVSTEQLPGGFPALSDYLNKEGAALKYFWQIQMPQVAINGGRIEITDTYTLLKPMTEEAALDFNNIAPG